MFYPWNFLDPPQFCDYIFELCWSIITFSDNFFILYFLSSQNIGLFSIFFILFFTSFMYFSIPVNLETLSTSSPYQILLVKGVTLFDTKDIMKVVYKINERKRGVFSIQEKKSARVLSRCRPEEARLKDFVWH